MPDRFTTNGLDPRMSAQTFVYLCRLERLAQAYGTLADLDHCDLMER